AVGHIAGFRNLVGDDIPAHREEIREHDLRDRLETGHGRSHGGAQDRLFGDRRVAYPQRPEFFEQTHGGFEYAARAPDVLAQTDDRTVAFHFLRDTRGNRV